MIIMYKLTICVYVDEGILRDYSWPFSSIVVPQTHDETHNISLRFLSPSIPTFILLSQLFRPSHSLLSLFLFLDVRKRKSLNNQYVSTLPISNFSPLFSSLTYQIINNVMMYIQLCCVICRVCVLFFFCCMCTVPTGKSLLLAQPRPTNRPIPSPGQTVVKPDIGPAVAVRPVTRPPLAGPYAFSRIPAPVWNKPRVFLRHALQDTWLFANLSTRYGHGFFSTRK